MYYGYVYLITNKINNKKYIGLRASPVFDENYWGSGKLITYAIKKYGKENFEREILYWCKTPEELVETEVNELKSRNVVNSDEYYNIIDSKTPILFGINNGFYGKEHTEVTKKIISEKNTGSVWSEKRRQQFEVWIVSEDGKQFCNQLSTDRTGKSLSPEHKEKIKNSYTEERRNTLSQQKIEYYQSQDGIQLRKKLASEAQQRFLGVPKTQEHKEKISAGLSNKSHPWQDKINKNPEKIRKTAEKHKGMKRSQEAKEKMSIAKKGKAPFNQGKKYYYNPNNPEEKTLCFSNEAPQGWINGIYKKSKI